MMAVLAITGCARDFLNGPLQGHQSNAELLPVPANAQALDANEPYIVMSFSGGGIRATGFAYAVLDELSRVPDRSGRTFADLVRIVSSASGGSVTAAWFGLKGTAGLPDLRDRFITQDNMWAMESQIFNPVTLGKLAGQSYSRVDVLRDRLDDTLFHHATFADMYGSRAAPLVLMNATDMTRGEVFTFRPSTFDDLCSNLAAFPLAAGVSASAAFPVLLTPVTLKNWSGPGCPVDPYPSKIPSSVTKSDRYTNAGKYQAALATEQLRGCAFPCPDPTVRKPSVLYQHLLDGGLVDNLGTSAILDELFTADLSSELRLINNGQIRSLVAIEVIARSGTPSPLSRQETTPGVISMIGAVIDNPIDSATRGNSSLFQEAANNLRQTGNYRNLGPAAFSLPDRVYSIQVDPNQFDLTKPDQADMREAFERIATSWTMSKEEFTTVRVAAHRLLYQHPCFVRLVMDRSSASIDALAQGTVLGDPSNCPKDAAAQTPAQSGNRTSARR